MDKLNTIVEKTLQMAENSMKDVGHSNPKVVIFYRDMNNELATYMLDLSPQKYFDGREDIMKQVGSVFKKMQEDKKIVRKIDMAVAYGEAHVSIDNEPKKSVVMASALDPQGNSVTRLKEIRRYMMPEHPEKQFFDLQDLEIAGLKHKSPMLTTLFENYNQ